MMFERKKALHDAWQFITEFIGDDVDELANCFFDRFKDDMGLPAPEPTPWAEWSHHSELDCYRGR